MNVLKILFLYHIDGEYTLSLQQATPSGTKLNYASPQVPQRPRVLGPGSFLAGMGVGMAMEDSMHHNQGRNHHGHHHNGRHHHGGHH